MTDTLPALRKTLTSPLPAPKTFALFTTGLIEWWPVDTHSLSGREGKLPQTVVFEAKEGGRVTEWRHDGEEADWAEITAWEPDRRLVLAWHVGRARSDATRIEVTFQPQGDRCEVVLTHSGFEVFGPAADAALVNYDEGWDMVLGEHFRQACEDRL